MIAETGVIAEAVEIAEVVANTVTVAIVVTPEKAAIGVGRAGPAPIRFRSARSPSGCARVVPTARQ